MSEVTKSARAHRIEARQATVDAFYALAGAKGLTETEKFERLIQAETSLVSALKAVQAASVVAEQKALTGAVGQLAEAILTVVPAEDEDPDEA
jgi:hypothetical protein